MTLILSPHIDDPKDNPWAYDDPRWFRIPAEEKQPANTVILQGGVLEIKGDTTKYIPPPVHERKDIWEFSRKSRFRLLKRIARIDWKALPKSYFLTLTYPDEVIKADASKATQQRSHVIRDTEKLLSAKLPMLWVKEMQDRKSGEHKGKMVHHWHMSIFTDKKIDVADVNHIWRKNIGWKWEVQVNLKKLSGAEHAAFYCAKYASKRSTEGILEYVPYLTKIGRHWGFVRDNLIPKRERRECRGMEQEAFERIQAKAADAWGDEHGEIYECYTFLGPAAERLGQEILEELY